MTLSPPIISLAPMMQRTDRHFRYMLRLITKRTLLYTEMVTAGAILHGDADFHLAYSHSEHPLALQLGGDDTEKRARCARQLCVMDMTKLTSMLVVRATVQRDAFGAVLTYARNRAGLCHEMHEASGLPVTVKHRISVDELDHYDHINVLLMWSQNPLCDSLCTRESLAEGFKP